MVRGLNSSVEDDIGWLAEFAGGSVFSFSSRSYVKLHYRFQEKVPLIAVVQVPRIWYCDSAKYSRSDQRWYQEEQQQRLA